MGEMLRKTRLRYMSSKRRSSQRLPDHGTARVEFRFQDREAHTTCRAEPNPQCREMVSVVAVVAGPSA